jgi:ferrochelatase
VNEVYDSWENDLKKGIGATKLLVIPMFPQYSESTIASGIDALAKELSKRVKIPTFEVITNFHRTHAFIDNSVRQVDSKINELQQKGKKIDNLIITFHGMQKRRIVNKGDDYYRHCYETFCLITNNLKHIKPEQCMMSFQSRFGSEEWITPYTEDVVKKLITDGKKEIAIYSPSFVADCLETTDELGHELVNEAKDWGGNIYPIECLNTKEDWCKDFAKYTFTQAEGSAQDKEDIEYQLDKKFYEKMPQQVMNKS